MTMHKYLPAIGFGNFKTNKDIRPLLDSCLHFPESSCLVRDEAGSYGYLGKACGDDFGLRLYVEYEAGSPLRESYYFPYADTDIVSTTSPCVIEQAADRNAFSGMTEETNLGISLIFFLSNGMEYARRSKQGPARIASISLTGLCLDGKILLPLLKTQAQEALVASALKARSKLMDAARDGDPGALEQLAFSDMNLAQNVSERLGDEDVYSLVDTCFMPCGLESDRYTIVGIIENVERLRNLLTGEELYRLALECNGLRLSVMMARRDLLGEPAVGRRFKGDIWLQGRANFEA